MTWAEEHCAEPYERDSLGSPPAFYAVAGSSLDARVSALAFLRERGISAWESNPQGFTLYDMLLASEDWRTVEQIADWIAGPDLHPETREHAYVSTLPPSAREQAQNFVSFARSFAAHGVSRRVRSAYAELRATGNVDVAVALNDGMRQALEPSDLDHGKTLATLMPAIFSGSVSPAFFRELGEALVSNPALRSWVQRQGGYHPNLAELMALLSFKDSQRLPGDLRRALVRGLSATADLRTILTSAQLEEHSELWGRLALECYSFAFYKHFTRPVRFQEGDRLVEIPSIFEALGMQPLAGPGFLRKGYGITRAALEQSETLHHAAYYLGAGFLDPETRIIPRQGGVIISNPLQGTLFLSNASPVTGSRDSVRFPIMYSLGGVDAGFTEAMLTNLDEDDLSRHFYPLLDRGLLDPRLGAHESISSLYQQWMGFRSHVNARIFDTQRDTAWTFQQGTPSGLQGAFFRPEFAHVLNYLEGHIKAGGAPLKLIFVERGRSAWETHSYRTHRGISLTHLEMTATRLDILRRLHNVQPVSGRELLESDVHPFLNSAGIKTQGWLSIMD